MVNIREVIEKEISLGICKTVGELCGSYFLNEILPDNIASSKGKEVLEEIRKQYPVWKEKYNVTSDTTLQELLEKLD